jgi:hypothetical protein
MKRRPEKVAFFVRTRLLAMAVVQSIICCLTLRIREQARSHI